eukprot:TRINITY_DN13833_c0_g1_i1.p1 TRINITY_DN13833_c0_g1~~TRINITY_DN13833_c0_g1_i1.p1  ORF type:complete len:152 (+),score=17.53 TRINITY_DN13833_c0_g1_i1:3-458(+)
MCLKDEEGMRHLLIHCQFAYRVWMAVINMFEMQWVMPRSVADLFIQWRLRCKFFRAWILWQSIFYAPLWKLWLEMNNRVFLNQSKDVKELVDFIFWTISEWVCMRKEFEGVSWVDLNRSWIASMRRSWCAKAKHRVICESPPQGLLELNFD